MLNEQKKKECTLALICAVIIVVFTCIGVVMNLVTTNDANFDHRGLKTFCMFTVNSNILTAIGMSLVIPYAIDGLRKPYYNLPGWLITFLLACTTSVSLTFIVCLFILFPAQGFYMIFWGSRFFLHLICPILAFVSFTFIMSSHRIPRVSTFFAVIPTLIYACVYFVLVVVIGEENGGWNDFYGFTTYVPFYVSAAVIIPAAYGLANLIRVLHNRTYERKRELRNTDKYDSGYLIGEIMSLARLERKNEAPGSDIVIPRRLIQFLLDSTDNEMDLYDALSLYLKTYIEEQ